MNSNYDAVSIKGFLFKTSRVKQWFHKIVYNINKPYIYTNCSPVSIINLDSGKQHQIVVYDMSEKAQGDTVTTEP